MILISYQSNINIMLTTLYLNNLNKKNWIFENKKIRLKLVKKNLLFFKLNVIKKKIKNSK